MDCLGLRLESAHRAKTVISTVAPKVMAKGIIVYITTLYCLDIECDCQKTAAQTCESAIKAVSLFTTTLEVFHPFGL